MSGRIVHLLRHAPPRRAGLLLGHTDEPPLLADCPVMHARVAGLPLGRIVTSDLGRASVQATAMAARRDLPLACDRRWRELDFGAWDGLAPGAVDGEALARFWADPDGCPPPRGECWSALRDRVAQALDGLDGDTLVVTHAGAMRAAISVLAGLDHRGVWALDLPYRALLTLRIWDDRPLAGQVVALDTGRPA